MKKWNVVIMGIILVLVLAACGNNDAEPSTGGTTEGAPAANDQTSGNNENVNDAEQQTPTAEELLTQITEASKGIKSYSMDSKIEQNLTVTMDGQEQKQDVNMDMKTDLVLNPVSAYQEIKTSLPGQEGTQEIKQYITEDGVYTQMGDAWMSLPEESTAPLLEQMKNQSNAGSQFEQLNSIANDLKVEEEGDVYWLKANLSGDKVKELATTMLSQSGATDPQMAAMMQQMNIKSMDISYSVDKETYYPKDLVYSMDMDMDMDGQALAIIMKMDSSLRDYNKTESIKVPQDVIDSAVQQQMPAETTTP
ncbi:hypothetical protein QPK24_22700 [Paenibacillus polygoni]|uniref:LppX_LprAFG lipoprotein n=1 Tax=Paenibacillus polygoni TaxID=3050112 RepID=A0ABY8X570_9BACL|nr:DUF6612 family protein [Paenibacillus polygoni]WIV19089.1 hypothetical protein QPK24_22700 [Paenibacillus polygoni]